MLCHDEYNDKRDEYAYLTARCRENSAQNTGAKAIRSSLLAGC